MKGERLETLPFELGPIRPVDEADSLLIRTTRGCPWNNCAFCVNYKDMRFSKRSIEDIKKDIEAAAAYYGDHPFRTCFFQDGDSFIMKTGELIEILELLKRHFPSLERVSSYGRSQTMIRKSPQEIREIADAGLNLLYCGMESGSDAVLKNVKKGVTAADHIKAAGMAKAAGMKISEFIILGLGGKKLWRVHAEETAGTLNRIDPHFIRVLTIGVKQGSGLEKQMEEGKFEVQTEKNIIEEQRLLIENLNGISSYYVNHHGVDLLMEARGQLPEDKAKLLAIMDRYLCLPEPDRINYTLGKRLGYYRQMDDMKDENRKAFVDGKVREVMADYPGRFDEICHHLRAQVV
jgi:radical SAM superfamily enzyme YgiQ (UPF0313 family)